MKNKKIVVALGMGGTIGMVDTPSGMKPAKSVEEIVNSIPELSNLKKEINLNFESYDVANIDSSNTDINYWELIGHNVVQNLNRKEVSGIVITHGTDTMTWTAQYLHFALKNLNKPVVLVGSQLGSEEIDYTDHTNRNVYSAFNVAINLNNFGGVFVCFDGSFPEDNNNYKFCKPRGIKNPKKIKFKHKNVYLLHPENLKKIWVDRLDAFACVSKPERQIEIEAFKPLTQKKIGEIKDKLSNSYLGKLKETNQVIYDNNFNFNIPIFNIDPSMDPIYLEHTLKDYISIVDGLVIVGYGEGHVRARKGEFSKNYSVAEAIMESKKPIVMCSSAFGKTSLIKYEVGRQLAEKVIPSGDWIPEYSKMRLAYLLGHGLKDNALKEAFILGINMGEKEGYVKMNSLFEGKTAKEISSLTIEDYFKKDFYITKRIPHLLKK